MTFARAVTGEELAAMIAAAARPILVDFWADWCGPCKALAPTVDELAAAYPGEVDVLKIDVVAEPAAAELHGARSIPLLVLFADGAEVSRSVGIVTKTRLAALIETAL